MAVQLFTDGLEPDDLDAAVWRFLDQQKFEDLLRTSELFFNRADRFEQDDQEGLPPEDYLPSLRLNRYDLRDALELNHHIASLKQFRESFYICCWHLFREETLSMWAKFGPLAVCTTYRRLKAALDSLAPADEPHLGLVRYGARHLTGWNTMRFITTKRDRFQAEREVRALLWIRDGYAGINRHFDENNFPHDRPLTPPPADRVRDFHRRVVDLRVLVTEIVLGPWTSADTRASVERTLGESGYAVPVRVSDLGRNVDLLPTAQEIRRLMK